MNKPNPRPRIGLAFGALVVLLGLFVMFITPGSIYAPGAGGYVSVLGLGLVIGGGVGLLVSVIVLAFKTQ